MRNLLALEWDQHEARLIVARARRGQPVLREVIRAPLLTRDEADPAAEAAVSLSQQLRELVAEARAGRARLLVGVSRLAIDLLPVSLPPCPDDSLPDLVRDEVIRELGPSAEAAEIDFVPLNEDPTEPRSAIAAAMSQEQLNLVMGVCREAGLKPARLVPRPFAAGSLLLRRPGVDALTPLLLVDDAGGEADLTVITGGVVVFSRTVRLPEAASAALLAEIRRTLIAVQNQPPGYRVAQVHLCGESRFSRELAGEIERELSLQVEIFDPFEHIALEGDLARELPRQRGRMASLVGMLCDEAQRTRPAIDFKNPKRAPAPQQRRKRLASLAAAAAAVVAAVVGLLSYRSFAAIDEQIAQLAVQSRDLDRLVKRAQEEEAAVAVISEWQAADIVWLDELRDLSLRFPGRRDAVLLRLTLGRGAGGGGLMELQGLVRDPSIVGRLENQLRDEQHEVRSKRVQENIQEKTFTWQFESSLSVAARPKEAYLAAASDGQRINEDYGPRWEAPRAATAAAAAAEAARPRRTAATPEAAPAALDKRRLNGDDQPERVPPANVDRPADADPPRGGTPP